MKFRAENELKTIAKQLQLLYKKIDDGIHECGDKNEFKKTLKARKVQLGLYLHVYNNYQKKGVLQFD